MMEQGPNSCAAPSSSVEATTTTDGPFNCADPRKKGKSVGKKPVKKLYTCPECEKSFPVLSHLNRHRRKHTQERPFHCDLCPKKFSRRDNMSSHRKHVHFPEQVQKLPCPECGKSFTTKAHLLQHQLIHQGRKPFTCVFFPKNFRRRSDLRRHLRQHVQEKGYFCKDCLQSYSRNYNLQIHRSGHTGDKYFKCPHCPIAFFYRPLLIAHRRQFHKEDVGVSYTCVFCADGFEFKRKHGLHIHVLRNHLREKGYFCKDCSMVFATSSDRLEHSNRKHHGGVKRYPCYRCDMTFYSSGIMSSHMRRHHRDENGANGY